MNTPMFYTTCDNCGKDARASTMVVTEEETTLCPYCYDEYMSPQYRTCGLCAETNPDISADYSKFEVKGFDAPVRVCANCINYDSSEQLHQIIRKL